MTEGQTVDQGGWKLGEPAQEEDRLAYWCNKGHYITSPQPTTPHCIRHGLKTALVASRSLTDTWTRCEEVPDLRPQPTLW